VKTKIQKPFYGVYYGQAALPMAAEDLFVMESNILRDCRVFSHDLKEYTQVYNMDKITSRDLYDVFLSGPQSLLEIENPKAKTDKELIVFRDSFGSSLTPLLVQDYAKVTVVDIRYLPSAAVGQFVAFTGQDVLFAYSTLILNTGSALK
jgi:Zn-dependent M16 (insulinase) family peptidase